MQKRRRLITGLAMCAALLLPGDAHAGQTNACPDGPADVVIDPGHGGDDPGAVVESLDLIEAELNLEIANDVADLLAREGVSVALTRHDNDTTLGNSERGQIANACGAQVLVMIHLNGADDPETNHTLTLWGEKPKDLALSSVMLGALEPLGIEIAGPRQFDNGGLLSANMPSVLVEAVFMTSTEEQDALASGERQDAIAEAIAAGVLDWLDLTGRLD